MNWNELQVGQWYRYPDTPEFSEYQSTYMKIQPVWSDDLQAYCEVVDILGEDAGVVVTHDDDPVWDDAEVTVY